jgi:hypothetical protein
MDRPPMKLPVLSPRYDIALRAAMDYIFSNFEPFAVIVSGSIVRGNPDASSDFDILVLHEHAWRRRVQKWFEGVPAEIFINSTAWVEGYLTQEAAEGRPIFAHMLATGVVVFSSSPKTEQIIGMARATLETGASFSEAALEQQRYAAACLFEDAVDVAGRDDVTAALILGRAVDATVKYWFATRQRFSVRSKEQLLAICAEDPEAGRLIEQTLLAPSMELRVSAAQELAQSVLGHTGFFEWDSGPSDADAR